MIQTCGILEKVIVYEKEFNKLVNFEHSQYSNFESMVKEEGVFDKMVYEVPPIPLPKEEKRRFAL